MTRQLSPRTTVGHLKLEAKRWLAAVRRGETDAITRLRSAWPQAPDDPSLRDMQQALAREYGAERWTALLEQLGDLALDRQGHADRVRTMLTHGWTGEVSTARRIAARFPEVRRANVFTAAACGDVDEVRRHLAQSPDAALAVCDAQGFSALAHVMYGRVDETHAIEIATMLIGAGADVHFRVSDDWGNPFTLLTGVAGDGEGAKPAHPQAMALAALLLSHGVEPMDTQLLYNTSLHHDDVTWLELLWAASEKRGTIASWREPGGRSLGGSFQLNTLDYLLGNAVTRQHVRRVEWLLAHGASARARHAYTKRPVHTEARLVGFRAGVSMLEAHGAEAHSLLPEQQLYSAIMLDDMPMALQLLRDDPSLLRRASPLHAVSMHGRTDVVQQLLALGADVHAADHEGATALHRAVQGGSLAAVEVLVAAGADVNRREPRFQGTALSWAVVLGQREVAEWLVPHSRDVRALSRMGEVERLRDVLSGEPALANAMLHGVDDPTPLFCFAEDDDVAAEVVRVLLAHGADRNVKDAKGRKASERAKANGLAETARALET